MWGSNNTTVVCRRLTKKYRLTQSGSAIAFSPGRRVSYVEALTDVSFVADRGESIGVLGKNGSGKSTLMTLLAGADFPTSGDVMVSAPPVLLSVSAGLQKDLSGTMNARMGLLARGLPKEELEDTVSSIGDWAELGPAMQRPLKTYSSGMKARLKFAIATAVHAEILLIDEAMATGDSAFTQKAMDRMSDFLAASGTVFTVSHSARTIRKQCKRAIWLDAGRVIADGDVDSVSESYEHWNKLRTKGDTETANKLLADVAASYSRPIIHYDSEIIDFLNEQLE